MPNDLIGVDGAEDIPLSHRLVTMSDHELHAIKKKLGDAEVLLPYIHNDQTRQVADRLNLSADSDGPISDFMNNKWETGEALRGQGISVCPRERLRNVTEARAAYRRLKESIFPDGGRPSGVVFGKLSRGAAGRGVDPLVSETDLERWINDPKVRIAMKTPGLRGGVFLELGVQGRETMAWPNLAMYVGRTSGADLLIGGSAQLLVKNLPTDTQCTAHVGNIGPLLVRDQELVLPSLEKIADFARMKGAFGFSGIDIGITPEGRIYYIEDNYRLNGSTSSAVVAAQQGSATWVYSKFDVPPGASIAMVEQKLMSAGLQANIEADGALVINSALPQFGDNFMQVVILTGEADRAHAILDRLKHLFD